MNTPAHLIFGLTVFGRNQNPRITAAAFFGALVPDLSLYLMAGWSLFIAQIPPEVVFGQMYFSDAWQNVFAVDNSIPLWALAVGLATLLRAPVAFAFAGAGLLHLLFDFPLHHDDARRHFWPLTDWIFHSPVSYWDPSHFGNFTSVIEVGVCVVFSAVLLRYFKSRLARGLILLLACVEVAPPLMFHLMFGH